MEEIYYKITTIESKKGKVKLFVSEKSKELLVLIRFQGYIFPNEHTINQTLFLCGLKYTNYYETYRIVLEEIDDIQNIIRALKSLTDDEHHIVNVNIIEQYFNKTLNFNNLKITYIDFYKD